MTDVSVSPAVSSSCDPWPIAYPCDVSATAPDVLDRVVRAAEVLLWAALGRRHGVCTVSVLTGLHGCGCADTVSPRLVDGLWYNLCGTCGSDCCQLPLPGPVLSVESVLVDGVPLEMTSVWWSASVLYRSDGGCWPYNDECDPGRVLVTYKTGVPVPAGGDVALGELVCELLAAEQGRACRLPSRVTNISRQGVTMDLADPKQFIDSGLFGLPLVDALIRAVNPKGLVQPSGVYSVDRRWW
jgi:hypothetical protein